MGLRDRLKNRIREAVDRLSGEHSDAAPDPTRVETYSRPGAPNEDAEVVMARLNRPGAAGRQRKKKKKTPGDGGASQGGSR